MAKRGRQVNRREDLLEAALDAFVDRGFEGTSVADLARATGLSKAAFVYHFSAKEELLFELSTPLLQELDEVLDRHEDQNGNGSVSGMLTEYLEALWQHRDVAAWIDGDKSILNHGDLGARLDANNRRAHRLLVGGRPSAVKRAKASAILGMLWRPIRNGYLGSNPDNRRAIVELASGAAASL
ncbi:MAG: TetR/AcrR family transcriptional regulator [Acidimicrobiia bacterium]|nr:TetR/AcrR family transcriptional regulator [Acidimicrobiia bacterium]